MSSERAREYLGYAPKYTLRDAVAEIDARMGSES